MPEALGRKTAIEWLSGRLLDGLVFLIHGPYGTGKTTILLEVARRLRRQDIRCVYCPQSDTWTRMMAAMVEAYPEVPSSDLPARQVRSALRLAIERKPAVLMLDHWTGSARSLHRFLRLMRGAGVGAVVAADIEHRRDLERLRSSGLKLYDRAVPPLGLKYMKTLLDAALAGPPRIELAAKDRKELLSIAHGRPGWINMLVERLHQSDYLSDGRLHAAMLATDVSLSVAARYVRERNRPSRNT